MTQMTGGQALVAALADHGVDIVFGIPGTHNLSVYAAMSAYGISNVSTRHEQGAGYAADGYARASGRPGVCVTTTGPAILNAAAAAAQAYSDSVPVLFISPGMPLSHPGLGNGLLHEIKNQSGAMDAVVAYSHRVTSVAEIPLAVAQAFAAMRSGRPRPIHLEIPLDLLDQVAATEPIRPIVAPRSAPDLEITAEAARILERAERPLLVVGGGATGAADQILRLAEHLEAPVIASCNGKGILPEDHRLSLGAGVQHSSIQELVDESDVVVGVGTEFAPSDWWLGPPSLASKLIRIDIDPTSVSTNVVPLQGIVADARDALEAILARLAPSDPLRTDRSAKWRDRIRAESRTEGEPWLEIIGAIAQALPPDAVVAADSAMVCYYGALSNLPLHRPRSFLYPTGAGTLGYGLPAGIGAKVGSPLTPVVVIQGDGGAMFTIAELATAAELGLALPVVIVDNGGYGEIRNEMEDRGDEVHAVALGHPDFPALARSVGCLGVSIDKPAELTVEIAKALASDRPTLLHIREDSRAAKAMQ